MAANCASIKQHLETFIKHVEELRQTDDDDVDGFEKEYKKIREEYMSCKAQNRYPATEAQKEVNLRKNRFKDITPFDYTRVILEEKEDVPGSDYINANFIKGVNGERTYIASQGPLPHTTTDFWRMLWQYKTTVVIMVCREVEMEKPRCQRYWPNEGETLQFDGISVTLIKEHRPNPADGPDDQFVFRELRAVRGDVTRVIHHLHFLAWPDRFVPSEYAQVIDLLAEASRVQTVDKDKPLLVVHCSAGCGRTGSLVVVDYVWNLLKANKITADFSLFDIIKTMRTQRPSFVQSEEQYYFVHKAIDFLFKEHLKLLNEHLKDSTSAAASPSDSEVNENVDIANGTIAYAGMSELSLSIIRKTVQELISSQKKEHPKPAPRRLGSDSTDKPVIPGKPNIPKKSDTSTEKTSVKPEKLIEPYEDVILKPTPMGAKPMVKNQKPEKVIEPYAEVTLKPTPMGAKPMVKNQKPEKIIEPYEEVIVQPTAAGVKLLSESDKQRIIGRPAVAVPSTAVTSEDANIYADVASTTEADTHEEEQGNEYVYADPKRRGKWSLQHIALEGVTSTDTQEDAVDKSSPFEPSVDYPSDESYDSDSPIVPPKAESGMAKVSHMLGRSTNASTGSGGKKVRADREAKHGGRRHRPRNHPHPRTKSPHSNERLPSPMSPSSSPATPEPVLTWRSDNKIIYQGLDISFPNRVKKPIGPRKFAAKR